MWRAEERSTKKWNETFVLAADSVTREEKSHRIDGQQRPKTANSRNRAQTEDMFIVVTAPPSTVYNEVRIARRRGTEKPHPAGVEGT